MANATDPLARSVRGMNPQVRDESTRRRHTKEGRHCADFERRKEDDDDDARGDYDDEDDDDDDD